MVCFCCIIMTYFFIFSYSQVVNNNAEYLAVIHPVLGYFISLGKLLQIKPNNIAQFTKNMKTAPYLQ
jgi:hypothetical protein